MYFSYPFVAQTSQVPVNDLPVPVVYVCQADQFNYTQARRYGCEYERRFMAGILTNSMSVIFLGMEDMEIQLLKA